MEYLIYNFNFNMIKHLWFKFQKIIFKFHFELKTMKKN